MKCVCRWCVLCHKDIFFNKVFDNKTPAEFCARRLGNDYYAVYCKVFLL